MPNRNALHVDKLLSNISVRYANKNYIAMELFPVINVKESSNVYRVYERQFRVPETKRAFKAEAREHDFDVSTASYVLERHSLKSHIDDREADNYDMADLRADMTEELSDTILRRLELDVANLMTTTSWSQALSLTTATGGWLATTTVDPVQHFDTGTAVIMDNSGQKPNKAAMSLRSFQAFKNNPEVQDRVKYTQKDVDLGAMAALIGVEKVLLALNAYDNSVLGATTVITSMWADSVLLAYCPASAGPLKPSAGYIFRSSEPMVKRYRVEERNSDCIEVNMEYLPKVVSSLSGFLIKGVY